MIIYLGLIMKSIINNELIETITIIERVFEPKNIYYYSFIHSGFWGFGVLDM